LAQALPKPAACSLGAGGSAAMSAAQHGVADTSAAGDAHNDACRLGCPKAESSPSVAGTVDEPPPLVKKRCRTSFKATLIAAIIASTVIACLGMLVALDIYREELLDAAGDRIQASVIVQRNLVKSLIDKNVTGAAFFVTLDRVRDTIANQVVDGMDDEIDGIWTFMQTHKKLNPNWTGSAKEQRDILANFTYMQLREQLKRTHNNPHTKMIKISWSSGEETGCTLTADKRSGSHRIWSYDMANDSNRTSWAVDWETGARIEPPYSTNIHDMGNHPAYVTQQEAAQNAQRLSAGPSGVPSRRLWTPLFHNWVDDMLGVSLTQPISYCGDYSCFQGVVEAFVSLEYISFYCDSEWDRLRHLLAHEMYRVDITADNSSVFIVKQAPSGEQEGVLVGASGSMLTRQMFADRYQDELHTIVNATATAILLNFSSWGAEALMSDQQLFTYRLKAGVVSDIGTCDSAFDGCMQVSTMSVQLDERTRWLVVVVLPLGAFGLPGRKAREIVDEQVTGIKTELRREMEKARMVGIAIFGGAVFLCIAVALGLSFLLSRRLSFLADLIRRLGNLDFAHDSAEFRELRLGTRSRIIEVENLQDSFCRLSHGIEAFARFVPETVVQNIVRGDPSARHLHVSRRVVTIMFSDVRDFTAISESLNERQLLYLLTCYFSAMTSVVESYEGVIAELLGDGLLAYWNAPGDVPNHAEKACKAALAQQEELAALNRSFAQEGLNFPELFIRIGLHTGAVLSGNIGSEKKMKFGCIGDPVNTASRLEGLCKVYGIPVLCSEATIEALPSDTSLMCRRLDVVRVKGKQKAISIHQVLGDTRRLPPAAKTVLLERATSYEAALDHFQHARLQEASNMLGKLLDEEPTDTPAARLLERVQQHEPQADFANGWSYVSHMTEK